MDISGIKRSIGVERTYFLGNYKNLRLIDTISELPVKFVEDPSALEKLRLLQFITIELAFQKYIQLNKGFVQYTPEDAIPLLEELRTNTLEDLKIVFNNHNEDEE